MTLVKGDGVNYNTGIVWSTNQTILDEYVSEQERFATLEHLVKMILTRFVLK